MLLVLLLTLYIIVSNNSTKNFLKNHFVKELPGRIFIITEKGMHGFERTCVNAHIHFCYTAITSLCLSMFFETKGKSYS